MSKPFYRINNKADVLEIDIEGTIGGSIDWESWTVNTSATKEHVKKLLKEIANSAASQIIVNINSYGGDVNHGVSIHDLLAEHKAKVTTIIHGHTASAATIISQAGDTRKMSSNALFLIHPASTIAFGNHADMETALSDLEKVDQTISGIYAKRTGKSVDEITEIMNRFDGRGEWLTAQEAMDMGFIDEVVEPMKAVASADPKILSMFGLPEIPQNKIDMKADKKTVFAWFEEFVGKIRKSAAEEAPAAGPETPETPAEETPAETPEAAPEPGQGEGQAQPVAEVVIRDMEEVRSVLDDLTSQNETLTATIAERDTQIQNLTDEVARLKGTATQTDPKEDPFLDKSNLKTNEEAHESNAKALRE